MSYLRNTILLIFIGMIYSCSNEAIVDDQILQGTWQLIEQYSDPGDGSGEYQKVDIDFIITFQDDGNFVANSKMCNMSVDTGDLAKGTYDEANNKLIVEGCSFIHFGITYEIFEGHLYLYYPCFEGCGQKFEKIK